MRLLWFYNGIVHNIAILAAGRYLTGFAGGFTGIGLSLTGLALTYYLWKEMKGV